MMRTIYIVFGVAVCAVFVYASGIGWTVWDSVKSGQWSPQGQTQQSVSHK